MRAKLNQIFRPTQIAVIGASERPGSPGQIIMQNLIESGYRGTIYPVNLKHRQVMGNKVFRHVAQIDAPIDLAMICTPARTVVDLVEECGQAGVGGVVILTAGFAEAGDSGRRLFQEVRKLAQQYDLRIVGPNCMGFISPHKRLNASYAGRTALPGNLAFISQSGALLTSILDWSVEQNVGFSHFVSVGEMVDVDFADLIDYFGTDAHTSCILIYMESLRNARRFMSAARAFSRNKPIIVLKSGRSQEGRKAAFSHTGSIAGSDDAYEAAFRRAGVIRVDTIAQLFNIAQVLAMQPLPAGNCLGIVTNAGGPGVLATDYLVRHGGQLAPLSVELKEKLNEWLPENWSGGNPIDVLGEATPEQFRLAVEGCLREPTIDGVLVILTPQVLTEPVDVAEALVQVAARSGKPVLAVWMGEREVESARDVLERGNVPHYRYPESAVDAFLRMYRYSRDLDLLYETPPAIPANFEPDLESAQKVLHEVEHDRRYFLTDREAKQLLRSYGIPTANSRLTNTIDEAIRVADEIGYPVVMKVSSKDLTHKTDAGGVILDIRNAYEVGNAYRRIQKNVAAFDSNARIDGILVEQMINKGFEMIVGAKRDDIFGPLLLFGRGGVAVEVYQDVSIGLPPLNMALAQRIIQETQIYPLLKGYRGLEGVDLEDLAFLLCRFSYLIMDFPEIKEVDINPYVAYDTGGLAVDTRIMVDPARSRKKKKMFQHLVISPYPGRKYTREFPLKDGQKATLRPIRPEDEPLLGDMLKHVSNESLYMRFFGYIPRVTHEWLTRFTHIDYDREMAIVAEVNTHEGPAIIGVVRIIEDAWGTNAEYSILVADNWHGYGLGNALTDYIIDIARERGLDKIVASVLPANKAMIHIFQRRGFTINKESHDVYEVELPLEEAPKEK